MNTEELYTYPESFETCIFPNEYGGISIGQKIGGKDDADFIVLTLHQAKWLSHRLSLLADLVASGEVSSGDVDGQN